MSRVVPSLVLLATLAACSESVSPRAERVFYRSDGMASWGTVCQLDRRGFLGLGKRGYISVAHVTENGTPLVGPKDAVTVADSLSDWSFLGIDPADLDPADYPPMRAGQAITIHGFPARDRDGEVIPGVVYTDDPEPPFWWVELRDADEGIAAEGVIGGLSGSCVFDGDGALVAVVHANGFSQIGGTTDTWAKVVPVREAIRQAQGRRPATMMADAPPPAPTFDFATPSPAAPIAPAPFAEAAPTPDAPSAYRIIQPNYAGERPGGAAQDPLALALLEAERIVLPPPTMDVAPASALLPAPAPVVPTPVAPPPAETAPPPMAMTRPAAVPAPRYRIIEPRPRPQPAPAQPDARPAMRVIGGERGGFCAQCF